LLGDGKSKVHEIAGGRITANEDARYPGEDLGIQYIRVHPRLEVEKGVVRS